MTQPALRQNIKRLSLVFSAVAAASLGGCATMNATSTSTCVTQRGSSLNLVVLSVNTRNDSFSEECATARAATAIAGMRRADGTPDMAMYNLAVSMYEQSNPGVRAFMDKMLKEKGTTIEALKFEIAKSEEPVVCEKKSTTGNNGASTTTFQCTDRRAQAPAVPAAALTQRR